MPINGAQPYELFDYAIGLAEAGELQAAYQQQGQDQAQAQAQATAQAALPREVPVGDAPAKGSVDAPVTIVEYSDYQCPFCLRHFEQTMPQLQTYIDSGQVRYVFKDFPIANIHPQAQKAHESARCARELGGDDMYWTMHDLLFMNQAEWGQAPVPSHIAVLKALAQEAGLPQAEFDDCLDSDRYLEAVLSEVDEGTQLGVRGTPAFFINGRPLVGAQPFTVFQQAIEQLLAEQ
jgi:protein-disulfide isomerase